MAESKPKLSDIPPQNQTPQEEIIKQQEEPQQENDQEEIYSQYSEGDQYDSDEGPLPEDRNNPDRKPFKQIQIDYQTFRPVTALPQAAMADAQEDIAQKKIQQYQEWLLKQQLAQQQPTKEALEQLQQKQNYDIIYNAPEEPNVLKFKQELDQIETTAKYPAHSTLLTSGYKVSSEELGKLIYPWNVHYDKTWNKNFYFNDLTKESVWELPQDIIIKVQEYRRNLEHRVHDYEERHMYKFLPKAYIFQQRQIMKQKQQQALQRPARKQVEQSVATKYAYRQGDEEYNIWFDKFLSDGNKYKERDAALTKCTPEADIGYTKADLYEKFNSYFCLHFTRGCCCEGVNCKFYHRIPTTEECEQIDLTKDIFGRSRYQKHREDQQGIGVFSIDTKSIYVTHYKLPKSNTHTQALAQMYEVFWRHFGQFGDIDDINILQAKGVCFIRFKHRCQAEFAKEALQAQALDEQEVLTIKWANDDPNPKAISRENEERKLKLINAVDTNQRRQQYHEKGKQQPRQKVASNQGRKS